MYLQDICRRRFGLPYVERAGPARDEAAPGALVLDRLGGAVPIPGAQSLSRRLLYAAAGLAAQQCEAPKIMQHDAPYATSTTLLVA